MFIDERRDFAKKYWRRTNYFFKWTDRVVFPFAGLVYDERQFPRAVHCNRRIKEMYVIQ